jgi:hypothetical protein
MFGKKSSAPGSSGPSIDHLKDQQAQAQLDASAEHTEITMAESYALEKSAQPLDAIEALNDPDWEAKKKKIVRRLDMTLLPMLWILYLFNYLDRTNIAQARLNTFEEDLGLQDGQFQIAVSVLTAG